MYFCCIILHQCKMIKKSKINKQNIWSGHIVSDFCIHISLSRNRDHKHEKPKIAKLFWHKATSRLEASAEARSRPSHCHWSISFRASMTVSGLSTSAKEKRHTQNTLVLPCRGRRNSFSPFSINTFQRQLQAALQENEASCTNRCPSHPWWLHGCSRHNLHGRCHCNRDSDGRYSCCLIQHGNDKIKKSRCAQHSSISQCSL